MPDNKMAMKAQFHKTEVIVTHVVDPDHHDYSTATLDESHSNAPSGGDTTEHRGSVGRLFEKKRESVGAEEHFRGGQGSAQTATHLMPKPRNSLANGKRVVSASETEISCESSTLQVDYLAEERARKRKQAQQKQKAVACMLCLIAVVFIIGNSGNFLLLIIRLFNVERITFVFQAESNFLSSLFTVAHHVPYAMNPIIYAIMSPKFREEFTEQTKNCPCFRLRSSSNA